MKVETVEALVPPLNLQCKLVVLPEEEEPLPNQKPPLAIDPLVPVPTVANDDEENEARVETEHWLAKIERPVEARVENESEARVETGNSP